MDNKNINLKKQEEDLLACNLCMYKFCMHWCPVYDLTKSESSFSTGLNHYALGILRGLVDYTDSAIEKIYQCTLCGACRDARCVAPGMGEPVDTPKIVEAMREDIVAQGKAPQQVIQMGKVVSTSRNIYNKPQAQKFSWVPQHLREKEKADLVYYVGCVSSYLHPEIPQAVMKILSSIGIDFAFIKEEACCGLPMLESGQRDIAQELAGHNLRLIKKMGAKKVLFSCPGCYKMFKKEYPEEFGVQLDFQPVFITDYLEDLIRKGKLKFRGQIKEKITYHDPCHLGRDMKMYDSPRRLITLIPGLELVELERNREFSRCCGAGGGVKAFFPKLSSELAEKRIEDALLVKANNLVTACPSCKENLEVVAKEDNSGPMIYDIAELVARVI